MLASRTLAAVGLGVALFGAGCGGTKFSPSAARGAKPAIPVPSSPVPARVAHDVVLQAKLVRAVGRTAAAHSARTSMSVTFTGLGGAAIQNGGFDVAGDGLVDFDNGDAKLSLSIPRIDRLGGGGAVEQRVVDGIAYTKMPPPVRAAAGVPAVVRWFSLDPEQEAGAGPTARSQSQADPAGQLAVLTAVSADVRTVGTERVRSVATTHYAATIDLTGPTGASASRAALRKKIAGLAASSGVSRLAVDAWLDQAGRVRRIVLSLPLGSSAGGVAGLGPDAMLRIQADFYSFGTPVVVAAPPQSEVLPYATLRIDSPPG